MKRSCLCLFASVTAFAFLPVGYSLACYLCSSVNRSDPYCEDTFNTDYPNVDYLQQDCMATRKDRKGFFPADHCIKVAGVSTTNANYTVIVRTCAMDSGSLTADTEIVRMSHCGHFIINDHYFKGCVKSCSTDGCNGSDGPAIRLILFVLLPAVAHAFSLPSVQ